MSAQDYAFTRRFGIEIEFFGNAYNAAQRITQAGESCVPEHYNHAARSHWKMVSDASVSHNLANGGELVSPVLRGEEGIASAKRALSALASGADIFVNRQCGFHAHFDVSDFTLNQFKALAKFWLKYEDIMESLVSPSRRGNAIYCRSNLNVFRMASDMDSTIADAKARKVNADCKAVARAFAAVDACTTIEQIANLFGTRYMKCNFEAYFRHRTIEFRLHQGTTNPEKVERWLRLLNYFIEGARRVRGVPARKDDGKDGIDRISHLLHSGTNSELRRYFVRRARALA